MPMTTAKSSRLDSGANQVMKIGQIKLRGLGETPESGWLELDANLTCIHFQKSASRNGFLHAVETINPPYDCAIAQPFADYPNAIRRNGYTKVISPEKRTIMMCILAAAPGLVHQLADISPLFYETDKIEVGRRLDYSRWLNFIELPSSSRWSEVSTEISSLLNNSLPPERRTKIHPCIENLKPTDRITGSVEESLSLWLNQLMIETPEKQQLFRSLLSKVNRAHHFRKARTLVGDHLPLFVKIDTIDPGSHQPCSALRYLFDILAKNSADVPTHSRHKAQFFIEQVNRQLRKLSFLQPEIHFCPAQNFAKLIIVHEGQPCKDLRMLSTLLQLQITAALAIVLSRIIYNSDPLLIFSGADQPRLPEEAQSVVHQINKIAGHCQCIYGTDNNSIFREEFAGILYEEKEFIKDRVCAR